MEPGEFWWRCTFGALGLDVGSILFLTVNYAIVTQPEMPIGPVHLTLLILYFAAAVGFLFWILAMEDAVQAASVFMLYILLPVLPVLLLGRIFHLWEKVQQTAPWLLSPS